MMQKRPFAGWAIEAKRVVVLFANCFVLVTDVSCLFLMVLSLFLNLGTHRRHRISPHTRFPHKVLPFNSQTGVGLGPCKHEK